MRKIYLNLFQRDSKVIAYGSNVLAKSKINIIKSWNIESKKYFLVVGRLVPDNNADLIINGFIQSSSKKKLVVVGDNPFKETFSSKIKKNTDSRIVFTGYIKDSKILSELYRNCYVYIHGHEFGGTNPTMIKAMNYGCAILALKTVFNLEMLGEGKYGIFFEKNLEDVSKMISYCDKDIDLVKKLRIKSKKGIVKKYDWDFITNQYIEVFNHLLKIKN